MSIALDISNLLGKLEKERQKQPAKAFARNYFLDAVKRQTLLVKDEQVKVPYGAMATFAGIPIYETSVLPKGVLCLFLDNDDNPVGQIVDEDYEPLSESKGGEA